MEDISLQSRIDVLSEEQVMIQDSAVAFIAQDEELKKVRANRFQQPGYDIATWQEMAEAGWLGFLVPEQYGGIGLTFSDLSLLLIQLGKGLVPAPFSTTAVLAARLILKGDNGAFKNEMLPRLIAGEWKPALAWQESRGSLAVKATQVRCEGGMLSGEKCFVPDAGGADGFLVSADNGEGTAVYLVDKNATGLEIDYQQRVDGGYYGKLTFNGVSVGQQIATVAVAESALASALDEARVAASAELLGVMTRALELTIDYISQREQFGKPIGSFQVLQHKSVDLFVLSEISRSVLLHTTAAFDGEADDKARAIATSQLKARCSDAALQITKDAIQLHGGIGYTDEANIGLYLKKAMYLSSLWGNAAAHRQRYAELAL